MKIEVKLFAVAKQLAESEVVELELPHGATVALLRQALCQQYPGLSAVMSSLRIAVDSEYVEDDRVIASEAEVACIPPVSGG